MSAQLSLFDEYRAASREDVTPTSGADRIAARIGGWEYQQATMYRHWVEWLRQTDDPARIAYLQSRIDYLRGIR